MQPLTLIIVSKTQWTANVIVPHLGSVYIDAASRELCPVTPAGSDALLGALYSGEYRWVMDVLGRVEQVASKMFPAYEDDPPWEWGVHDTDDLCSDCMN
jgi:hypothetical protein